MPIYEYRCQACGQEFECLVFRSDDVPTCKSCDSPDVQRLISACGFVSKGAGGQTVSASAGASCGSCSSTHCSSCGH